MADVILLYGPGQTYANEEAVFAAIPTDVVASGNRYICRSTKFESVRSTRWVPTGKICDATHNIIFEPAPGAGWLDSGAELRYNPANGAAIKVTGDYTEGVYIAQDWMVFRGFQVWQSGGGNSNAALLCDASAPNAQLYDNIAQVSASGNYVFGIVVSAGTWTRNTSILLGTGGHGVGLNQVNAYTELSHFTVVRVGSQAGGSGYGFLTYGTSSGTVTIKDSVVMNMAAFTDNTSLLSTTSSNNASDGTVGFGTNNLNSQVFANTFRVTSGATADYRLKAGSALLTGSTTGGEIGAYITPPAAASALTLSGAASVTNGYTTPITVGTNNPLTGSQSQAWSITDGASGVFTPSSGTLNVANPTAVSTYAPAAGTGSRTITASATGTPTLSNATKSFTVTAPVNASNVTLSGGTTGTVGVSQTITVGADQPLTGSQTESVALSSPGGTFSPSSVTINLANQTATSQFTPTSSGSKVITAVATGTPTLANATKTITVALPAPTMVAGLNTYEIGPGKQFADWATFRTFINSKNLVALAAKVRAIIFGAGETIGGDLLPIDANATYNITIIADLTDSYVGAATSLQYHYPNAGVELTFTSLVTVVRGTRFIGFRYNFQGAGALKFGTNYGDATESFLSGIVKSNSTTVPDCVRSGEYAHDLSVSASTFIRTAGTGRMLNIGDGHGVLNGNTFVCTGTGTVNGIACGFYGGVGACVIQNNAFVACGDEPVYFNSSDYPNPDNYKNNYTDTALNSSRPRLAIGLTAITGSAFVLNTASDLRPVISGPLYHKGNALVTSINDAFGQNRGITPDAGAYQREPAAALPILAITSNPVDGQRVTVNVTTTNTPTTVLCSLIPDSGVNPNTAVTIGPLPMTLTSGAATLVFNGVLPGSYGVVVSGSNTGGTVMASGGNNFKINAISGTPEAPDTGYTAPTNPPATVTSVSISPASPSVQTGNTVQMTASVVGLYGPSQAVVWSITSGPGTISSSGLFTSASGVTSTQTTTVTATSAQDNTKSGSAIVTTLQNTTSTPVMTGTLSVSTVTSYSFRVSWFAAIGSVSSYEVSIYDGNTYIDVGANLFADKTNLLPGNTYNIQVRAVTSAGVKSAPLTAVVSLPALVTATTVTFAVVDSLGSPVNASGLDYAFYDYPRINAGYAPVKVGNNLVIVNGVATISIAGVTSLLPGGTGRIEWGDSNGIRHGGGPVVVT